MGTTKQINVKNRTYCFYNDYNDIIDLENFDYSGLLKIDKKSYEGINIYYTGYVIKKNIDKQ